MNAYLIITGSTCLIAALIEAWMLVGVFSKPDSLLAQWIPGAQDLLKSHIDYLMMALLLYVFYLAFEHFRINAGGIILGAMCLGALGNPGLFLVRAIKPSLKQQATPLFQVVMFGSCSLTTLGFLGAAFLLIQAAWQRL